MKEWVQAIKGLRPLYPESDYEWITPGAVISKDEVAMSIMGHRKIAGASKRGDTAGTHWSGVPPGQETAWGPSPMERGSKFNRPCYLQRINQ